MNPVFSQPELDPYWYRDAVIYQLHVRSFYDANGDGIGDFRGLVDKLDYLHELGVSALWLLPFYPSPLRDDGYDIADFGSINPSYGSMRDFRMLLREAHRRDLRVITELVLNHTSRPAPVVPARPRGRSRQSAGAGTTSGATPPTATPTRASSSRTSRPRTGRGIRSPGPTTGTASTRTSPT